MPLYEYLCDACGHRFEVIQRFSDPRVDTCPECAGVVRKMQSAPAFQLKGTGWYATDYAKKEAPPEKTAPGDKAPTKDAETTGAKESAASAAAETKSGGGQADRKTTAASDKPASPKTKGTVQS